MRYDYASAIINSDSTSPALVVIGGVDINYEQLVNDCLLFDNITTGQFSCKKVRVHVYVVHVQYCNDQKLNNNI